MGGFASRRLNGPRRPAHLTIEAEREAALARNNTKRGEGPSGKTCGRRLVWLFTELPTCVRWIAAAKLIIPVLKAARRSNHELEIGPARQFKALRTDRGKPSSYDESAAHEYSTIQLTHPISLRNRRDGARL